MNDFATEIQSDELFETEYLHWVSTLDWHPDENES